LQTQDKGLFIQLGAGLLTIIVGLNSLFSLSQSSTTTLSPEPRTISFSPS